MALILSGYLTSICAVKLIRVGNKMHCYSYSGIIKQTLGKKGELFLNIIIALSQFGFSVGLLTFMVTTSRDLMVGLEKRAAKNHSEPVVHDHIIDIHNKWTYGLGFLVILTLLAFVRNIAYFSFTFVLGNILILLTVICIVIFSSIEISKLGISN